MLKASVGLFLLAIAPALSAAIKASQYARSEQIHPDMTVYWTIEQSQLRIALKAKATGWVGFGIAEAGGMRGADIMYYEATSNQLIDAHAFAEARPIADECQDWTLILGEIIDGEIHVEATRALSTGDTQDWPIVNDANMVEGTRYIAAWSNSETIQYHGPEQRTHGILRFHGSASSDDPLAAIKSDPDVKFFDVTEDNFVLPTMETFYQHSCGDIVAASGEDPNSDFHIIAFEAIVSPGNQEYVHHFTVHAFASGDSNPDAFADGDIFGGPQCRGTAAGDGAMVWVWAPGVQPLLLPEVAGMPMLGQNGVRGLQLQLHYDNPAGRTGVVDSSGVRIYYSSKLRQHDAGVMQLGDPNLWLQGQTLAQGLSKHSFQCDEVTSAFADEEVTVFYRWLHMHEFGERMVTRQYDSTGALHRTDAVEVWDFKMSGGHFPMSTGEGFKVRKGDTFGIDCLFRTDSADRAWGLGSRDEMCIDFVFYYPLQPGYNVCGPDGSGDYLGQTLLSSDEELGRSFGVECSEEVSEAETPANGATAGDPTDSGAQLDAPSLGITLLGVVLVMAFNPLAP